MLGFGSIELVCMKTKFSLDILCDGIFVGYPHGSNDVSWWQQFEKCNFKTAGFSSTLTMVLRGSNLKTAISRQLALVRSRVGDPVLVLAASTKGHLMNTYYHVIL